MLTLKTFINKKIKCSRSFGDVSFCGWFRINTLVYMYVWVIEFQHYLLGLITHYVIYINMNVQLFNCLKVGMERSWINNRHILVKCVDTNTCYDTRLSKLMNFTQEVVVLIKSPVCLSAWVTWHTLSYALYHGDSEGGDTPGCHFAQCHFSTLKIKQLIIFGYH